jgi:hypothetical protein
MTAREDLHRLVDELDEERVDDARELLRRLRPRQGEPARDSGTGRRRVIAFTGALFAEHDLAEHGEEIMRTELGHG